MASSSTNANRVGSTPRPTPERRRGSNCAACCESSQNLPSGSRVTSTVCDQEEASSALIGTEASRVHHPSADAITSSNQMIGDGCEVVSGAVGLAGLLPGASVEEAGSGLAAPAR